MFNFYYDESEHSRIINHPTITGETYYDNFLTAIVGWDSEKEADIRKKYLAFEEKYKDRKKKGELKSDTFKSNQFKYGFASFNKQNIELLDALLEIIDNNFYIYFCIASKLEFIILQLFKDYHNNFFVDMDAIKYSIVKTVLTYHPDSVIQNIYSSPEGFVESLILFFKERIEINRRNPALKFSENEALSNILMILQDVKPPQTLNWDYHMPFVGFDYYLKSKKINDYTLTLDKEGKEGEQSKTLIAATEVGLMNCVELNSKNHFGLRIADMLAGIVGKLMKSLFHSLHNDSNNAAVTKTLLDKAWFMVNDKQLDLYKKLYHILLEINNDWYKIYAGNYSDDLISLLGLLDYMNHFESADEIMKDFEKLPEYCNACICNRLQEHFERMHNKLPVEPVIPETKEYFRNNRGAKIYFDISRQPEIKIVEGHNKYYVLTVGNSKEGTPLVTIAGNPENICFRLPNQLCEWALTVIGMANMGENLFPSEVVFTKVNEKIYADIL